MCNVLTNMEGVFSHTYNQVAGENNHTKVFGSSRMNSQTSLSAVPVAHGIADVPPSVAAAVGNGSSAMTGMGNCNRTHNPGGASANHQQPPSYHSAIAGSGVGSSSSNCSPTATSALLRNNASSNGVQAQQHLLADNKQSSTSSDAVVVMNRNQAPNPSSSPSTMTANTGGAMKNATCDVFL